MRERDQTLTMRSQFSHRSSERAEYPSTKTGSGGRECELFKARALLPVKAELIGEGNDKQQQQ